MAWPMPRAFRAVVPCMPGKMRGSLTWDQGTERARHAALTLATHMPVYFAPQIAS